MTRIKKGKTKAKRRRSTLSMVKGYRGGRGSKKRQAREAIFKAGQHAFAHRRDKKNDYRRLFIARLNAGLRAHGMSYSVFIGKLNKLDIRLNRKMLSELAAEEPRAFEAILKKVA